MKQIIFIYLVFLTKSESKVSFRNWKKYIVWPTSDKQFEALIDFQGKDQIIGNLTRNIFNVSPRRDKDFNKLLHTYSIEYKVATEDLGALLGSNNYDSSEYKKYDNVKINTTVGSNLTRTFNWKYYHSWTKITNWFKILAKKYPRNIKIFCVGRTFKNRNILGVKLSFSRKSKPGVFLEGGAHGNEWISPATATYILGQFLTSNEGRIRNLAQRYDWYILPVANPDGYIHAHTVDRRWVKTLSKNDGCLGVNIDRNWGHLWGYAGASVVKCTDLFAGNKPFSEIETRSLARFLKSIAYKLFAYISFHSSGQKLGLPYGYTDEKLDNYEELLTIGKKAINALKLRYGTEYKIGPIGSNAMLGHRSGLSTDWVKAFLKLPIVYFYKLRGTSEHKDPPRNLIIPNGEEVMDSFVALFNEAERFGYGRE